MKLPKRIEIGPYTYGVREYNHNEEPDKRGYANHNTQSIHICRQQSDAHKSETLMHETLHCLWWVGQIEDSDNEERTVQILSMQLMTLFKRNPKLKEALFGY